MTYNAASEDEAHYLVGILNSPFVNEVIKPFQTQGIYHGERDIQLSRQRYRQRRHYLRVHRRRLSRRGGDAARGDGAVVCER